MKNPIHAKPTKRVKEFRESRKRAANTPNVEATTPIDAGDDLGASEPPPAINAATQTALDAIAWPILSAELLGAAVGVSPEYLRKLARAGRFKAVSRGRFKSIDVFRGMRAALLDHSKKSRTSDEARALAAARRREIEIRTAAMEGDLLSMESLLEVIGDVVGSFRSRLAGVPAAVTRDPAMRARIESEIEAALDKCRADFRKKVDELV